jgi:hypothetical protein
MTEPVRSSERSSVVTGHQQARLLTDPRSAAFIYPFLARERSTAEAARDAGCAITTMAYRVRVLRAAGLLKATRTSRRAGRPITYYRSSQDTYRVPLAATGFIDHRDQTRRIGAPIYQRITDAYSAALARSGTATRFITRDDHGGIYSTDQPPHRTAGRHPLLFEDRILHLTAEQAERLCNQLDQTLDELTSHDHHDGTARQTYAVMVAAVPTEA